MTEPVRDDRQKLTDLERNFRNLARRERRAGSMEKVIAYNYAAWLVREALRED